MADKTVAIIK